MEKKTQDLAWACLPKETRADMRRQYKLNPDKWSEGWNAGLKYYFGHHNLTSDTEPEEMLMVERKKVQELYARFDKYQQEATMELDKDFYKGEQNALVLLFGDKCLPDKPNTPNSGELKSQEAENELYTEPETKDNMEEKDFNLCKILQECEGEQIFLTDEGECKIVSVTEDVLNLTRKGNDIIELRDDSLFLNPTGCAYAFPSMESFLANPLNARKAWQEWSEARKPKRWRAKLGEKYWVVDIELSPTRSEEKNDGYDEERYNNGNYFRTEEEANQAADGIREYLKKFHEEHIRQ